MLKQIRLALTMLAAVCGATTVTPAQSIASPWMESVPGASFRYLAGGETVISQYDPIIRRVASESGYDWRFISAIANAESRFESRAVSGAGAVGLMQVMPAVARGFKIPEGEMTDPATNVAMGVRHLGEISKTFRFPGSISERDRLSIILASYNCGPGRVLDARRLASKYGENHNSWSVVSKYLRLLGDPAYYGDEVVRTGAFNDPGQTLGFVSRVLRYYDSYRRIAVL